ncbi:hypothetical protein SMICM304S_09402 [Streptomyces microflavus]
MNLRGIRLLFGLRARRARQGGPGRAALIEETVRHPADKSGFKYAWASEHHFLEEYSHLSANDVYLGYLAHATDRIHLGSGIFNPLAPVNHPVKVAEKVAMLDHLSEGRFEFGTGRGRAATRSSGSCRASPT